MAREQDNFAVAPDSLTGFDGTGYLADMPLEISQREWFSNKARHAALDGFGDMTRIIHNGQHDKGNFRIQLTHPSQEFQSGHVRHHPIADDKVQRSPGFSEFVPRTLAIFRHVNVRDAKMMQSKLYHCANI